MQALLLLILFAGAFLVLHGVYEDKLRRERITKKVEYRFIPRTYYEEQMDANAVSGATRDMFNRPAPIYDIETLELPQKSSGVNTVSKTRA